MNEVICLIDKHTLKPVWTYKSSFYDTLYSVRVWDNSDCKGYPTDRPYKSSLITLAEYREKQIKSVLDD